MHVMLIKINFQTVCRLFSSLFFIFKNFIYRYYCDTMYNITLEQVSEDMDSKGKKVEGNRIKEFKDKFYRLRNQLFPCVLNNMACG